MWKQISVDQFVCPVKPVFLLGNFYVFSNFIQTIALVCNCNFIKIYVKFLLNFRVEGNCCDDVFVALQAESLEQNCNWKSGDVCKTDCDYSIVLSFNQMSLDVAIFL